MRQEKKNNDKHHVNHRYWWNLSLCYQRAAVIVQASIIDEISIKCIYSKLVQWRPHTRSFISLVYDVHRIEEEPYGYLAINNVQFSCNFLGDRVLKVVVNKWLGKVILANTKTQHTSSSRVCIYSPNQTIQSNDIHGWRLPTPCKAHVSAIHYIRFGKEKEGDFVESVLLRCRRYQVNHTQKEISMRIVYTYGRRI